MAEERKVVVERVTAPVTLLRQSGSFDKDGKEVKYQKFVLSINGAEVDLDLDKSSKNLLNAFVRFEKV